MFSTVASAETNLETLKSGETNITKNSVEYNFYSEIIRTETGGYAKTSIEQTNGGYMAANTVQVRTCLYNSNGTVIKQTQWGKNSNRATKFTANTNYAKSGTYYVKGEVKILSGSTWTTYSTEQTGTLTFKN